MTTTDLQAAIDAENERIRKAAPAFPSGMGGNAGLTKREYMATALMASLFAGRGGAMIKQDAIPGDASAAVQMADALLLELAK